MSTDYIKTISSGGVVVDDRGNVLVIDQDGNWSLPKGHVEDGEGLLDTAKREIEEESGVSDLEYVMNLGNYQRQDITNPNELKNIFMFLFKTHRPDKDTDNSKWVERNKVADLLSHPKDKEFFQKVNGILEV